MKRKIAFIFTALFLLSLFAFWTFAVSAESVTGQEITLGINGNQRTGTYTGPLENGLPHGRGRFEWEYSGNRSVYEGDFANGILQGQGVLTVKAKNGEWAYTGEFVGGVPQGELERIGGDGLINLIRSGGALGFALWLVIALMIFLTMLWIASIREMAKRHSLYRAARAAGTVPLDKSFWRMSGNDFAMLNVPDTSRIVGQKPVFTQIMGLVTIIAALDIWWAIGYGFSTTLVSFAGVELSSSYILLLLVTATIWQIVKTVIELRKSISVENGFVNINGTYISCSDIAEVSAPKKGRIIIKINGGPCYTLAVINAQAISDAILANKKRV